MNEHFIGLPFGERVRLARNELNRARPLLDELDEEGVLDDIIAKWGLNSDEGYEALLKPLNDRIEEQKAEEDELLKSPFLIHERIKKRVVEWYEDRKKK